ncbi:MAG: hypothetical protein B6D55_08650 [Candidatus Omnitrophica bacterium 4484_70.2]|nr:MAG: hypothetical protein B6D55_08650 [Candidatus Omnitrophica bacterium 4484_70.2]
MRKKINKRLLSVEEVAHYLNLKKQTIYNWLHNKKITGIKIGKVWRFEKEEIDKWLQKHKMKSL